MNEHLTQTPLISTITDLITASKQQYTAAQRPSLSLRRTPYPPFTIGAKQLVVQDALDTMFHSGFTESWFTPMTTMGVSSLEGADRITFFAPPLKCALADVLSRNAP